MDPCELKEDGQILPSFGPLCQMIFSVNHYQLIEADFADFDAQVLQDILRSYNQNHELLSLQQAGPIYSRPR